MNNSLKVMLINNRIEINSNICLSLHPCSPHYTSLPLISKYLDVCLSLKKKINEMISQYPLLALWFYDRVIPITFWMQESSEKMSLHYPGGWVARDRALVSYALLPLQNNLISMKCFCSFHMENKTTTTWMSILQFQPIHCWQKTWPLSQYSAPTTSQGGKNSSYRFPAAHSAQLRPPQMGADEDKRFPKTELANKKLGDTLALEKKEINNLFINITMVLRRMS